MQPTPLPSRFSVIIPTKNRPESLIRTLQALLKQSLQPETIIVVDQSESDRGRQLVQACFREPGAPGHPRLIYIHDPNINGLTAARNVGVQYCQDDMVGFCDDDVIPDQHALFLLAHSLDCHSELVGAGGILTDAERQSLACHLFNRLFFRGFLQDDRQAVYGNWDDYSAGQVIPTKSLCGSLMMIRRAALNAIGGFDPQYRGVAVGEDMEVSQRLSAYASDSNALGLVGGVGFRNAGGAWRARERLEETLLVSSHYLWKRKPAATFNDRLRLVWLSLGLLLRACAASVKRRHAGPVRSYVRGVRMIQQGYAGCDFLTPLSPTGTAAQRALI